MAEIRVDSVIPDNMNPSTHIFIGEGDDKEQYYIFEANDGYEFTPGSTVNISTSFYNDGDGTEKKKITRISPNTTYRLTITLNGDGTGTATLKEITA